MADEEKEPKESSVFMVDDRLVDAWGREVEAEDDSEVGYNDMTAKQLMAEIDRRNRDRDEDNQIVLDGRKKSDAVAALEADDKAADAGDDEEDTEE